MGPVTALVLYAVVWFMVLFVTLPIRRRTQGDVGEIVPGTQAGAPVNFNVKRTMLIVTLVAFVIWVIIAGVIVSGVISVHDLDMFNRMDGGKP